MLQGVLGLIQGLLFTCFPTAYVDDVEFFILLKNLKVKQKTILECSILFDFSMKMFVGPVGSEKPVGFFSLVHSDASQVKHRVEGIRLIFHRKSP